MSNFADPDAVRSYYERVDDGAYEALLDLFAGDVTYDRPGQDPIRGIEDLETFYREERPLSNGSHVVEALVVDGDRVAVQGRFEGEQGGETVDFGFADFHTFDEDGDIVHRHTYTDRDEV
jgi:ketosteroid isomerase-like protein